MATKRTYSQAQRRALLHADRERGHLRLTDSAGNRMHGMTLRALLRHGLIQRLWQPIPLTEFGAAEALRLHQEQTTQHRYLSSNRQPLLVPAHPNRDGVESKPKHQQRNRDHAMPPPLRTRNTHDNGIVTHEPTRSGDDDLADRQPVAFTCPKGHDLSITFAGAAIPPSTWECRHHGIQAQRQCQDTRPPEQQPAKPRSHWDLLRERRLEPELAQLLDTQLHALHTGQLITVDQWLHQAQAPRKPTTATRHP